jgi:demethylmenaquinone methyltransferase / 2-methoxy-6-polyprenyl-1,4-benzoquinol methylase
VTSPPEVATQLFSPIAASYERWAAILSLGQDRRWRESLVEGIGLPAGTLVLDVAAGTGSITRSLTKSGFRVVALDQSPEMLAMLDAPAVHRILATGEKLPLASGSVGGVTFGYLLRYVEDLPAALAELARVVRPGGIIAALEFGRPRGPWGPLWWLYTRVGLPVAGLVIGEGWAEVGRFLGPSIDRFWAGHTPQELARLWAEAGIGRVRWRSMSLGGGFLIWGIRGD